MVAAEVVPDLLRARRVDQADALLAVADPLLEVGDQEVVPILGAPIEGADVRPGGRLDVPEAQTDGLSHGLPPCHPPLCTFRGQRALPRADGVPVPFLTWEDSRAPPIGLWGVNDRARGRRADWGTITEARALVTLLASRVVGSRPSSDLLHRALLSRVAAEHGCQPVEPAGARLLALFASTPDALRAAVALQEGARCPEAGGAKRPEGGLPLALVLHAGAAPRS